jgi:hypothetical protein
MTITARAGRADLVTDEFNRSTGSLRHAVREADLPPAYAACWRAQLLSRPMFVDEDDLHGAADDVLAFFELLTDLPRRLFDGDREAYCAALGVTGRRGEILRRSATGPGSRYGRADLYHDGTGSPPNRAGRRPADRRAGRSGARRRWCRDAARARRARHG